MRAGRVSYGLDVAGAVRLTDADRVGQTDGHRDRLVQCDVVATDCRQPPEALPDLRDIVVEPDQVAACADDMFDVRLESKRLRAQPDPGEIIASSAVHVVGVRLSGQLQHLEPSGVGAVEPVVVHDPLVFPVLLVLVQEPDPVSVRRLDEVDPPTEPSGVARREVLGDGRARLVDDDAPLIVNDTRGRTTGGCNIL